MLHQRESNPYERSLDVHISHLRKKLERGEMTPIRTVRGVGYMFTVREGRMRSVYAKVLLWCFGTLVFSLLAFAVIGGGGAGARLRSRRAIRKNFDLAVAGSARGLRIRAACRS